MYEQGKKYPNGSYRERNAYRKEEEEIISHIKASAVEYKAPVIKEGKTSLASLVRVDDSAIKPLRLISSELIGGIFDRVHFLEKRISELRASIELRKQIHQNIDEEIEKDIGDRNSFMQMVSDINEKRNLKLDISVLRKERRNENVQFWRDLVELETELRKLQEEFEIETKIAGIFGNPGKMPGEGD